MKSNPETRKISVEAPVWKRRPGLYYCGKDSRQNIPAPHLHIQALASCKNLPNRASPDPFGPDGLRPESTCLQEQLTRRTLGPKQEALKSSGRAREFKRPRDESIQTACRSASCVSPFRQEEPSTTSSDRKGPRDHAPRTEELIQVHSTARATNLTRGLRARSQLEPQENSRNITNGSGETQVL